MAADLVPKDVDTIRAVGQILNDLKWPAVLAFSIYIAREGVTAFIKRMVNLDFSFGKARGTMRAEPQIEQPSERPPAIAEGEMPRQLPEPQMEAEVKEKESERSWFWGMYGAFLDGRIEEGRKLYAEKKDSVENPHERIGNRSIYLHLEYTRAGNEAALANHEQLLNETQDPADKEAVANWLSWSYSNTKNYAAEQALWLRMLEFSREDDRKANYASRLSGSYVSANEHEKATELVQQLLRSTTDPKSLSVLYSALGEAKKASGDVFLSAIAYEKAAQYKPNDIDKLFSAAYSEGNGDLEQSSYLNYDTIIAVRSDHAASLNNVGVQSSNLGMSERSVNFYRLANKHGNTLAAANLAYLYIGAGFFAEAEVLIREALNQKETHPNVAAAHADLEKKRKNEEEAHRKAIELGTRQRAFIWSYADARFRKSLNASDISGPWLTEDSIPFEVAMEGQVLSGAWEQRLGVLETMKLTWTIKATVVGRSLEGYIETEPVQSGMLAAFSIERRDVVGYLGDDGHEVVLMTRDKKTLKFIRFTRTHGLS